MYVDSNIFVFAALDTDERGKNARKIIERAEDGKITIYIGYRVLGTSPLECHFI